MLPDGDDQTCINCSFVLYAGQDPSEVYWQQLQQKLQVVIAKPPPVNLRFGRVSRKKRYREAS